jgi:hypothetical protein
MTSHPGTPHLLEVVARVALEIAEREGRERAVAGDVRPSVRPRREAPIERGRRPAA